MNVWERLSGSITFVQPFFLKTRLSQDGFSQRNQLNGFWLLRFLVFQINKYFSILKFSLVIFDENISG